MFYYFNVVCPLGALEDEERDVRKVRDDILPQLQPQEAHRDHAHPAQGNTRQKTFIGWKK